MTPAENLAHAIASTFMTQPQRAGREWRCYCPVHESDGGVHRPSLAVWDRPSGYGFKCMTGCSRASIKEALAARGVAVEGGQSFDPAARAKARVEDERRRQASLFTAQQILADSLPPQHHGPVWHYLQGRYLKVWDHLQCVLEHDTGLVGAVCDLTTIDPGDDAQVRVTGCSVLQLTKSGTPRLGAGGKKFRTIHGTTTGYGVPFGKPGPRLLVAEGIESMIAGMELLDVGFGVAVLSASNMPNLAVPEWVDEVVIAADSDQPGLDASILLIDRLHRLGIGADYARWGTGELNGWDAADELQKRKQSAV